MPDVADDADDGPGLVVGYVQPQAQDVVTP